MPQTRRGCGSNRILGHRGRGLARGSTPPPSQGGLPEHQIDDERNTGDSTGGETNSDTSEDLLDGTTKQHPHGTPPDASPTHPTLTKPTTRHPIASLYTSTHTQCRTRPTSSPEKEKTKRELPDEASVTGKHPHHHHQGPAPALLILVALLVLVGIYSLHQAVNKAEEEKLKRPPKLIADIYADLKFELQGLNREFSQPREVWLGLLGQLEEVMVEKPQQPAVIMFVVPDDSRGTAACLAHRLAKAIQDAFEDSRFIMFDTRSSEYQDASAVLKVELDETLAELSQAHVAVVHNVESIPGPAAMILHAYCDNENAPYKQAIIFLLAEISGTYNDLGYSRLDSVVDSHLTQVWGAGLAEKDVSALISRTCNTPILIRPEEAARVMQLCPL